MSLTAGTLGRYQIIREIARSNDIVYEAWDPTLNRRVALKELFIPSLATPSQADDRIRRFEREARAAGTLTHPNIVTIYEVGCEGDRHFIAMEYLEGESLRQRLDAVGALGETEAIRITSQVLEGLAHAHEKGIVHRDIKPDNIHILSDGRVKITDLGIARVTHEPKLTVTGQILGTPSYMSPEQVHGEEIDVRSDVWSMGVVLYEAISGTRPFSGAGVMAIAYSVLHDQPPDPPGASYGVTEFIRTALSKSVDSRFSDAGVMLRALKKIRQQPIAPPVQPIVNTPYYQSQPPAQTPKSHNTFSMAGWIVAGLCAIVVLFLVGRALNTVESGSRSSGVPEEVSDLPRTVDTTSDSRHQIESHGADRTQARAPGAVSDPKHDALDDRTLRPPVANRGGFQWKIPARWTETHSISQHPYHRWEISPGGHVKAFFDVLYGDTEDEFRETLRQEAEWNARGEPFARITLERSTFQGLNSALRVYEKNIDGKWVRRLVHYFHANGNGYALGFQAPPEDWGTYQEKFRAIEDSFVLD